MIASTRGALNFIIKHQGSKRLIKIHSIRMDFFLIIIGMEGGPVSIEPNNLPFEEARSRSNWGTYSIVLSEKS